MTSAAITVEELSKRYRIGLKVEMHDTFGGALADFVTRPLHNLRRLHRLSVFRDSDDDQDDIIWALKGVSFEVPEGQVLGVIGRNGSGKTTLLRILCRITEPTGGRAVTRGRVSSLLEVGTGFHPELTGRENVYLNGAVLGMGRKETRRKFDEIVEFSGVEKFIDTPVKRYSTGMQVRLAFAVAAHLEPDILLVDEVLAVGDLEFQKKCLGKMDDVTREGRTVLLVSHNITSIASLCPRALLLENGQIAMEGVTHDVIGRYVSSIREASGERVWDDPSEAPGDDKIRLHAVRTMSPDGTVTSQLDIQDELILQVAYWNRAEGASPHVTIHLYDDLGNRVLSSGNLPSENSKIDHWFGAPFPRGLYETECRIPANLMNKRGYSVTVVVGTVIGRSANVREKDVLGFTMNDRRGNEYWTRWGGSVHPKLAWSTRPVEASDLGGQTASTRLVS